MTAPNPGAPTQSGVVELTVRPTRTLPTERVKFEKQMDLLRAYAAVSGPQSKIVTTGDVASVAKLNPSTVSLCNGFFADVGFIERTPTGFVPAPSVFAFQRAFQWNPSTAAHKLAPNLRHTWFYERLAPRMEMGPLAATEAIHELADAAQAHKRYESQLSLLLDFLEAAGLIRREGDMLRLASPSGDTVESSRSNAASSGSAEAPEPQPVAPTATVSAPAITRGMSFNVEVNVDMHEVATWTPAQITAFFAGVAQVMAAKAGVDSKGQPL